MLPYAELSPFPPIFHNQPWAYALGLFGDVVAASLSLTVLLGYIFESRRVREVYRRLGTSDRSPAVPKWSPLYVYRSSKIAFLTFVVMRTGPDAVWMLAWGEVSRGAVEFIIGVDLWMDFFAIVPLCFAIFCWAWGRQVIPQKLSNGPDGKIEGRIPWGLIRRNAKIVFLVLLIAIGVTIGKASA